MASAVPLYFSTLLLLTTVLFARNAQAIIAKKFVERGSAVEVGPGQLPWLALLELPGEVYCTGTIVSPTSILSAALCLNGAANPGKGTAYAGNIKYTEPTDFDAPTQKRSIVEYHMYDENNPLIYNFMLVKIDPKWTWTRIVQPIAIVEHERLPSYFTPYCNVSGLGYGSNTEEDSKVARSADMWMGNWRVCMGAPQEHRMCTYDHEMRAPCVGDLGGSVLCDTEPKEKLYGIISEVGHSGLEEHPDNCKLPARASGFQFVGFYAPWITKTAGDLPSDEEVKAIRAEHEHDKLPAHLLQSTVPSVKDLFESSVRKKRDDDLPEVIAQAASTTVGAGAEAWFVAQRGLPFAALLLAASISWA